MNEIQEPQAKEPPKDPLRELVSSLTPEGSNNLKAVFLPPKTGIMFLIGPFVYRVGAINEGKLRFSADFYGIRTADGKGIIRPGGEIEYGPPPPIQQPPPPPPPPSSKNITLDVHSGSLDGAAIFKPRAANGQTPVE
jgi:hypothetical protein